MNEYYVEDGNGGVTMVGRERWVEWLGAHVEERRVGNTTVGEVEVSTMFFGLDYDWGEGPPRLYETMVFGGELDGEMARYSTRAEAVVGHERMVERVKEVG